ncbi:3-hydroxyisobutyrate dehydrogenase [Labrys wisconsinensis]|uniref:3-hydroxyisobutyrate dehydrogenase n=2 Tax=Labrys wisconsinensis TaxID=425677 RepID=A0ABU0JM24_9HYPH|nr:3-hydroxyisobutyrate dehydrogenase [Labrys wisconsinensis]
MAANLARAGFRVVAGDVDAARSRDFAAEFADAAAADGPASFREVDALVTMLPNGKVVRQALLDGGIADVLRPGTVVIEASSSDPFDTQGLGRDLSAKGILLVDSPVSGGMAKALDATLSIMLGADDEAAAERAVPVLKAMSARIFRTGGLGTGHAMKALNNFVLGAGFVAAAEALVAGGKFGLDPKVMVDVLNASSGRNVSTETTMVTEILPRRFAANFTLALFSKDVGIASSLSENLGIDSPLCRTVFERLADAGAALGWQADYTTALQLWESRAGIELPAR